MPHDDRALDELLCLAGVSTSNSTARDWLGHVLAGARTFAAGERRPTPTRHNAPLDRTARCAEQLIADLEELRRHSHAYGDFWRFSEFDPVYGNMVERPQVVAVLNSILKAARNARVNSTGRPPKVWKQHIVNLALAFCARYSNARPSTDVNNFFSAFAERLFELATGLSVEKRGNGIRRQIWVALHRLSIELERARHLHESSEQTG